MCLLPKKGQIKSVFHRRALIDLRKQRSTSWKYAYCQKRWQIENVLHWVVMYSLLNFTVICITLFQLSLDSEYNNQLCIVLPKEIITQEQQQKSKRRRQSEPLNSPKTIVRENRKKFATWMKMVGSIVLLCSRRERGKQMQKKGLLLLLLLLASCSCKEVSPFEIGSKSKLIQYI